MALPAWLLPATFGLSALSTGASAAGGKKGGDTPAPSPLETQLAQQGQQIMDFSTGFWPGWQSQFNSLLGIPTWVPGTPGTGGTSTAAGTGVGTTKADILGAPPAILGGYTPGPDYETNWRQAQPRPQGRGGQNTGRYTDWERDAIQNAALFGPSTGPNRNQGGLMTGGGTGGGTGGTPGYWQEPEPWDPRMHPAYQSAFALGKDSLEGQYGQARENILGNLPPGGQLLNELASLERGRAETVGQLPFTVGVDLAQDMLNKAYQVAFGMPTTGIQATGSAAGLATDRLLAGQQADMFSQQLSSGFASDIGEALGMMTMLKALG